MSEKKCTDLENGRNVIHDDGDDDHTSRPSTSRTFVNTTQVEYMMVGNRRVYLLHFGFPSEIYTTLTVRN